MSEQTPADDAPLHYYALTFSGQHAEGRVTATTYWGWPEPQVSVPRIDHARDSMGLSDGAVLLACCYLGRMTPAQMRGAAPLAN